MNSRRCARRERPRRRAAAEQRDECAPFQLIEEHSVPVRPGPDCTSQRPDPPGIKRRAGTGHDAGSPVKSILAYASAE
jgi:hypothetical protein